MSLSISLGAVPSTYLAFLAVCVGLPVIGVTGYARARGQLRSPVDAFGVLALMIIAFTYTLVWDGSLIETGVWWYGEGVVTARLWVVPIGELAFFLLQTALTGVWLYAFAVPREPTRPNATWVRPVGLLVIAGLELSGLALTTTTAGLYLGSILLWGAPVLGLLWFLGGPIIWRARRPALLGILVPTGYLWLVDRIAIGLGLWTISPRFTTGVSILGLPLEEMVFFLVTNTLIVFGLLLYRWVIDRTDRRTLVQSFLGLVPRGGVGRPGGSDRA